MPAYQVALCEDEPMDRDQLAGLCREVFSSWNIEAQLTAFPSADALRAALPLGEIRWVESRDHGVVVCLGEEERAFPLSLRDAERLLPGASFRRCHKSYLVNMDWVDHLTRGGVILRDKRQLPVSRTYYAGFQSALVQYLNQRRR